jgi:hypothetical protein
MKLSELEGAVTKAQADEAAQNSYVQSLGQKVQEGETSIEVFADNIWTTVDLKAFWQVQYDKYLTMAAYAGKLVDLNQTLQAALNDGLKDVVVPVAAPNV